MAKGGKRKRSGGDQATNRGMQVAKTETKVTHVPLGKADGKVRILPYSTTIQPGIADESIGNRCRTHLEHHPQGWRTALEDVCILHQVGVGFQPGEPGRSRSGQGL
jgi:hypothetical protein